MFQNCLYYQLILSISKAKDHRLIFLFCHFWVLYKSNMFTSQGESLFFASVTMIKVYRSWINLYMYAPCHWSQWKPMEQRLSLTQIILVSLFSVPKKWMFICTAAKSCNPLSSAPDEITASLSATMLSLALCLFFFITSIALSMACTYCQQQITSFNVNKDCIHRQDILFAEGSNLSWGTENKLNSVNRRLCVYLAYTEIDRLKTKTYYEQFLSSEDLRSSL